MAIRASNPRTDPASNCRADLASPRGDVEAATAALPVEAHDLVKTYPSGVRALDRLSLSVRPGEVFGLLGPNGAGKSTAIKILTTLTLPDSGTARVTGHDVPRASGQVRKVIGVVAQRSGADLTATGRDNLVLQGRLHGMSGEPLRRRVGELLERFDLAADAHRPVRAYSGGMRRRLDVALGLVHDPRVLFLDEPTTGLDPEVRAVLWVEIGRLAAAGLSILLTTHYLEEADRVADRIAIVDRGRLVVQGTPDGLKGELHGDAVHVELREPDGPCLHPAHADAGTDPHPDPDRHPGPDALRRALAAVPGVREIGLDGHRLSARADDGAAAVPAVLAALDRAGAPAAAVTVARPSLDDVYLRHVGHRFVAGAPAASEAGAR